VRKGVFNVFKKYLLGAWRRTAVERSTLRSMTIDKRATSESQWLPHIMAASQLDQILIEGRNYVFDRTHRMGMIHSGYATYYHRQKRGQVEN